MSASAGEAGPKSSGEPIEAVFAVMESPLLVYAQRWIPDQALAEDVVQEAFMKLHRQFADVREPKRWLYRTVHHLALNCVRDSAKIVPFEASTRTEDGSTQEAQHADPGLMPDEALANWERSERIRELVGGLDERGRELIRLKFEEGLSYQAMAERTGLTSGHVGYLLHHALKTMGDKLRQEGIVP